jgi:exonuclease SbcC
MRPLRIEFEAFGSYPGTVDVDFQVLAPRGLFVITGATGTGKTTIFDAMAYALYGEMPQKDSNDIRSHHAAADAPTWVRFTFEVDGVTYVAERSPAYLRAKRTGTGVTSEKTSALVTRHEPGGSTTRAMATSAKQATSFCVGLLGLSLDQFSRVMLLPQGSIARFLLDGSVEREKLLGQLFGSEVYERVVQRLKTESDEAKAAVGRVEEEERHLLANARSALRDMADLLGVDLPDELDNVSGEQIAGLVADTESAQAELADTARSVADAAVAAGRRAHEAEALALRFDEVVDLRVHQANLDESAPAVQAAEVAALRSQAARPVVVAADDTIVAELELSRRVAARDRVCADLTTGASQVGVTLDVSSASDVVRTLAEATTATAAQQVLLERRAKVQEALVATDTSIESTTAELREVDADIADTVNDLRVTDELLAEIEPMRRNLVELDDLTDRLERSRRDHQQLSDWQVERHDRNLEAEQASDRLSKMWQRFVATQAPRLASDLREGEPCPVCGACEHPSPAVDLDGEAVSFDQVQQAQQLVDQLLKAVQEIDGRIADLRVGLGELAGLTVDELMLRISDHAVTVSDARAVENRHSDLTRHRASLSERLELARQNRAAVASRLDGLGERRKEQLAELVAAQHDCAELDDERVHRTAERLEACRALAAGIDAVFSAVTEAEARDGERRSTASRLLEASEFSSFDQARAVLLDEHDERRMLEAAVAHRERSSEVATTLQTLIGQGVPEIRPNTDGLRDEAAIVGQRAAEVNRRQNELSMRAKDCDEALSQWRLLIDGSAAVRRRAEVARRAYQVCAGQGTIKMSLHRWVLANELDRVTNAASVHLGRMTGGRYGIRRMRDAQDSKSVFGLDLEILDAHTGRPRRPPSLSGGEQFQASLALALGLADVVSMGGTGSGCRMDALFVDEGFGSLDPKALDDAIETLHQLQATGRMVGAITHVEAMKERLHVGISVEAIEGGRGSKLTVIP